MKIKFGPYFHNEPFVLALPKEIQVVYRFSLVLCYLLQGPVYLLVRPPLKDLLVDLLVKVQRDLLLVSIYSSGSKSISKSF